MTQGPAQLRGGAGVTSQDGAEPQGPVCPGGGVAGSPGAAAHPTRSRPGVLGPIEPGPRRLRDAPSTIREDTWAPGTHVVGAGAGQPGHRVRLCLGLSVWVTHTALGPRSRSGVSEGLHLGPNPTRGGPGSAETPTRSVSPGAPCRHPASRDCPSGLSHTDPGIRGCGSLCTCSLLAGHPRRPGALT